MRLATRQYGLVTRAQLRELGYSDRAISRRLAAARLVAIHPGVYAVGHGALSQSARWLAAVLTCGPGALLSHGTAAALWELLPEQPARIHVTRAGDGGRTAPRGVCLHRYVTLADGDVSRRDGIPVTSVSRTLLDLAGAVPPRRLRRAIAQADVLRRLRVAELERLLETHRGRPGTPALAAALAEHRPERGVSRSDFEDRLAELCERHGLPAPRINARLAGLEVDVSWPEARVVAEADSFSFHRTRAAFENDRERDAILTAAGYIVHRFTERQLRLAPETVVAALRRSLADRGRLAS
jgi:very-short-patch-repair endonuclease